MNNLQWSPQLSEIGRELGYSSVDLHYNSGRHISTNGREFAELLKTLVGKWPVPVEALAIVAHSMGGLVTRSACHYGAIAGHDWLRHLRKIVFLATPHHGAPLERGGSWVDVILGASPYSAPFARLGKIRSAGITDLRHGNLLDEDWEGRDRFERSDHRPRWVPLPEGVLCYALAASKGKRAGSLGDRLLGDGLVPVNSALGRHEEPGLSLPIPESRQWIGYGMNHLELLHQPVVFEQLKGWLVL
jgi:pimeloyl-ACP methyl ester carboxylesterase